METYKPDLIRTCIFRPYRKGCGPTFRLRLWDIFKRDRLDKNILKYELSSKGVILFAGEDFACSPMDSIDSDACVVSIMGFLALKSGDTDDKYFDDYTVLQKTFCNIYADALKWEVDSRFCDENGNVKTKRVVRHR